MWTDKAIEKLEWIPLLGAFGALIVFAAGICWKILFPAKGTGRTLKQDGIKQFPGSPTVGAGTR